MESEAFGYKTKSIVGSVDTINTDITFYSPDELSKILQLKRVTNDTIINATNKYINKFQHENNPKLVTFFKQVKQKLLHSLKPENKRSIVKKTTSEPEEYNTDDQLSDWFRTQNQIQDSEDAILYPLGTTDRKQKVDIYDDHHNVMTQEKLAVQHSPSVIQGQINPNMKNTINRIVNIDSKFRLSAVPNTKNKKFRDIVNHHTSAWSGTDYTLDFNDPLRKVLSFKLYSLQIPYSWYTIDTAYGTSCFVLKQLTTKNENIINGVSGVAIMENTVTRFVAVDGFNIVNKNSAGNVLNFNNEIIDGLTNNVNMPFFFINDTSDIIDSNGVRVKAIAGKQMKVLVNSKNNVNINKDDGTNTSLNRILDVNGFPTRFLRKDFSEPLNDGTFLTNADGTLNSKLYFTIDKYGNTVTHISIDSDNNKIYEHSPKIIIDNKKTFLNVDSAGNMITLNSDGTVKYLSSETGIDLNNNILFNSDNSFKNSTTIHDVIVDNGNYTPIELVTEINNKLKENIENTQIVTTEISYYDDFITASTVQLSDRKIIVGGKYYDGIKQNMIVCRYITSGILDTTFNTTGKLTISIDINDDELSDIVYTSHDNNLIFGGTSINDVSKARDFIIGRINSNGTLDDEFGTDKTGSVRHDFGKGDDVLTSVVCQNYDKPFIDVDNDGADDVSPRNIFAGGYSYNITTNKYDFVLLKMNEDGVTDTSFGTIGTGSTRTGKKRYATELLTSDDDILTCMALSGADDAKLVVAGYSYDKDKNKYECIIVGINTATGVLDTDFGTIGTDSTRSGILKFSFQGADPPAPADSILRCITVYSRADNNTDYLVGGYVFNLVTETYDFAIARITSAGALNTVFNSTGIKIIAVNEYHNFLTSIAVDTQFNIIVSGYTYNGTTYDFTTIRIGPNGTLDTTFGPNENGITTTTINNMDLFANGIIPNLDGKITVVGNASKNSNTDFALTRYTINGYIDSTFVNKTNEKTYATMTYNGKNGKSTITSYNKFYSILFYRQNEPFCTPKCGQGPRANNNLGWICGFRDQEYTSNDATTSTLSSFSFSGEAIVDTFGSRYFLLSIDDYNSNQINKAIVSIENVEKKADIPDYYSSDLTPNPACDTSNSLYPVPQYLQGRPAQITQAQQYTLNEIIKNRKETSNNVLTSPSNSNVFAIIPLKKSGITPGDALIEFSGPIQINERNYFGPVDIDKIRVTLLDDKGNIVNLNGMDWSFSVVTEHLYQY